MHQEELQLFAEVIRRTIAARGLTHELTPRQVEVAFRAVVRFETLDEIACAVGFAAKSSVEYHLDALADGIGMSRREMRVELAQGYGAAKSGRD